MPKHLTSQMHRLQIYTQEDRKYYNYTQETSQS